MRGLFTFLTIGYCRLSYASYSYKPMTNLHDLSPICTGSNTNDPNIFGTDIKQKRNDSTDKDLLIKEKKRRKRILSNPLCLSSSSISSDNNYCPKHSFCFLGYCPCHPGYSGDSCDIKSDKSLSNPWYNDNCPNLEISDTYDLFTPLESLGGEYYGRKGNATESLAKPCGNEINRKACAYLCYSHPEYGTAVVPMSLWEQAQLAEAALWQQVGQKMGNDANDRAKEHWKSFNHYQTIVDMNLWHFGKVIEVGAGPWTQLKAILHVVPEIKVEEYTIWEPSADKYMRSVASCSYRDGKTLRRWEGGPSNHPFPVKVISNPGESLHGSVVSSRPSSVRSLGGNITFDTLISINVIEHVQDAFRYLSNLFLSLKQGGLLILHERYYDGPGLVEGDRYHPVRIRKPVLDHFLSGFDILFNNCSANYEGRVGEQGYYVIARKL